MFDLWENNDIKSKIFLIINKLIDPFNILQEKEKSKNAIHKKDEEKIFEISDSKLTKDELQQTKILSDKITLNTQILTLNFINSLLSDINVDREISDDQTNKLDYIFNLLISTYSINSHFEQKIKNYELKEKDKSDSIKLSNGIENLSSNDSDLLNGIKKNNSEIIEKFTNIIS